MWVVRPIRVVMMPAMDRHPIGRGFLPAAATENSRSCTPATAGN